jgi:hypothetical protein
MLGLLNVVFKKINALELLICFFIVIVMGGHR